MALTSDDLAAISKLLEGQEQRLEGKIEKAQEYLEGKIDSAIEASEKRLEGKIEKATALVKDELSTEMGNLFEKTWELIDENKKKFDEHIQIAHKN